MYILDIFLYTTMCILDLVHKNGQVGWCWWKVTVPCLVVSTSQQCTTYRRTRCCHLSSKAFPLSKWYSLSYQGKVATWNILMWLGKLVWIEGNLWNNLYLNTFAKGSSNLVRAFSVSSSTANHLVIEINFNKGQISGKECSFLDISKEVKSEISTLQARLRQYCSFWIHAVIFVILLNYFSELWSTELKPSLTISMICNRHLT